jgi:Ni,Fe-hydrogenase III large subunit
MRGPLRSFFNGQGLPLSEVPLLPLDDFLQGLIDEIAGGCRVIAYFGAPARDGITLYAILAFRSDGMLGIMATTVNDSFPSLSSCAPQLQLFEREIAEQFGIVPEGHPWFKPVRFHRSFRPGCDAWGRGDMEPILPGVMEYYRVEGSEVHDVAVGPVHAGVIEPGHFRFQCHGEVVFHLEISLGYQHRGIETGLSGGPYPTTLARMEAVAGDTTIGHTQAYAMVMEALAGALVPPRGEALRGIALELERLANHTGDLGALANDVGYLPTASYCGRIRGDFLNMSALLCGSRFGRGMVRPGGTGFDCAAGQAEELIQRLTAARADLKSAVDLLWNSASVMARLEKTGTVTAATAAELGLVGPAARASGLSRDVRRDHPYGIYLLSQIPVMTAAGGDVLGRTLVRWLEAEKSLDFLGEQLRQLPGGACRNPLPTPAGSTLAVALTEGWRGEICHVGITDTDGRFARYKIIDPSFHNWSGLAMALRNEQISDFPLCNKSFNLSYCGFDL